jgi:hypothetical protein
MSFVTRGEPALSGEQSHGRHHQAEAEISQALAPGHDHGRAEKSAQKKKAAKKGVWRLKP